MKWTNFVKALQQMLNSPRGFREEALFFISDNQKQECLWRPNVQILKELPMDASCQVWFHLAKLCQRRRFLKTKPIRIKNCPWRPCLFSDQDEMNKFDRWPPIDTSCQVWFHLVKWLQRRRFLKTQPIRIKNFPWRPCLLSDQDEMKKRHLKDLT